MTRKEQLTYCRICQYRQASHNGLICRITRAKADFEDECFFFLVDEKAVQRYNNKKALEKKAQEQAEPRVFLVSLLIWIAVIVIGGMLASFFADLFYVGVTYLMNLMENYL